MKKEKSLFQNIWFWTGIVAFVIIIYLALPSKGPREYDSFATCLTEKGVVMYGTDWCPHCKEQKKMFGASFDKINYVNCDKERDECLRNGVKGYPTWKINGESLEGTQPLSILASESGCELVKDGQ